MVFFQARIDNWREFLAESSVCPSDSFWAISYQRLYAIVEKFIHFSFKHRASRTFFYVIFMPKYQSVMIIYMHDLHMRKKINSWRLTCRKLDASITKNRLLWWKTEIEIYIKRERMSDETKKQKTLEILKVHIRFGNRWRIWCDLWVSVNVRAESQRAEPSACC